MLELPRGGKVRAQDAAVEVAGGEILAFSDANSLWEPDALERLLGAFTDPRVGYACGQVRLLGAAAGTSQEGVYWRYEMALRENESRLCSITGGNGAIYAVRREAYVVVDPIMGHDLSFPFKMVKRGLRAVYVPSAVASEKMVPSLEGEFARKRRMMSHTWPILLRGGMLSPRGYPPAYIVMILSHRVLRYLTSRCTWSRSPPTSPYWPRARERSTWSRSCCSSPCSAPPGSAAWCARGSCWWPATTFSRPPPSPPACGTG